MENHIYMLNYQTILLNMIMQLLCMNGVYIYYCLLWNVRDDRCIFIWRGKKLHPLIIT